MPDASDAARAEPRWLSDAEMQAWLRVLHLVMLLPVALDRQLRQDAGLGHAAYMVLATLSDAPERSLRMTELARRTATSPSRLSHTVASLEQRGWVSRRPCPEDRRGLVAALTDEGLRVLEQTAPGHVARVRATVLDPLNTDEVVQLASLLGKVVDRLEADERPAHRGDAPCGD